MYYKNSGRFSLGGLLIGAALRTAASVVLAWAYARGIILIPEARAAIAATIFFGALIGVATAYGLIWGKVRNEAVYLTVTGIVSTIALYFSWAIWVDATLHQQKIPGNYTWTSLAQRPGALWDLVCLINKYGTWGLEKGSATNGLGLWLIWGLEAAIVIGIAMALSIGVLHRHAFCEACNLWCKRGARIVLAPPQSVAQLKLQLEANDMKGLEGLAPGNKSANHLKIDLDSCPQCCQFHTMSLTYTGIQRSKWGKQTMDSKTLMQHLVVGPGHADILKQLSEKVKQAAKIAPPKANAAGAGK